MAPLSSPEIRWPFCKGNLDAPMLVMGMMSGTSADGIDVALLRTDGESRIQSYGGMTIPYDPDFRRSLMHVAAHDIPLVEVLQIEAVLTDLHAAAALAACHQLQIPISDVRLIGLHGHTIRHCPAGGWTWQLGDAQRLAQQLGCRVVSDFRRADMASGGEGAPLAALYHQAIVPPDDHPQLVLNLGGVANITWLGGPGQVIAGDTGPGCSLLDNWVAQCTGERFDRDGELAREGNVDQVLVDQVLDQHPFFRRPLPKSADRFDFAQIDVSMLSPADGAATLCAVTAQAIARAVAALPGQPSKCWVTGGGRFHPRLMQMLGELLPHVAPISALGHSEELLEAHCFGWLAVRHVRGLPTSLPSTTGARVATVGGVSTAS